MLSVPQQRVQAGVQGIPSSDVMKEKKIAVSSTFRIMTSLFTQVVGPTGKVAMNSNDIWVLDEAGSLWYCNKADLFTSQNPWQKVNIPKVDSKKKDAAMSSNRQGDITIDEDGSLWLLGGIYDEKKGGFEVYEGDLSINKKDQSLSVKWDKKDGRMVKISAGKKKKNFLASDNEHIWGIDAKGQLYCREKIRKTTFLLKGSTTSTSKKWTKIKKASKVVLVDVVASEKDQVLVLGNNKKIYKVDIDSSVFNSSDVEKSKLIEQQIGIEALSLVTSNIFVGTDFAIYYLSEVSDMMGKNKQMMAQKMSCSIPATAAAVNNDGDMMLVGHDGSLYYATQVLSKIMPKTIMTLGKPVCSKPAQKPFELPVSRVPELGEPQSRPRTCGTMDQFNRENQLKDFEQAPSAPIGEIKEEVVYIGTGSDEPTPAQ